MRIKKSDTVKIICGKDKGKTGTILKVLPKKNKVLIEGFNLYKKRVRPKTQGEKGETILVPRPLDISNVMLVCSSCGSQTTAGFRFENDSKTRICKKCGAKI